jgi:hypothetical protein
MEHPDFYALLSFAEDALKVESRRQIAKHILICERCSAELRYIEEDIVPEMERPADVMERLSWLVARLVRRAQVAPVVENSDQAHTGIFAFVEPGGFQALPLYRGGIAGTTDEVSKNEVRDCITILVIQGADQAYRYLTVLDEDEAGALYPLMSIYGVNEGAVYCWPVGGARIELPFIHDREERHCYRVFLTDRDIPLPEGSKLDSEINEEEHREERQKLVARFLEALESEEVKYRTAEYEVEP